MLAGEAVVAIWNGIADEGRADFYAWHLHEHMPERVGIPGFHRGRRYAAVDPAATDPEFFTLYEADTLQVLQGGDYAGRLNAPSAWTQRATQHFRDTARALAVVLESGGPGVGGALLTLRFDTTSRHVSALRSLVRDAADAPRVAGAHLCMADDAASGAPTAESRGRADIQAAPGWFILLEATDPAALADLLPDAALFAAGVHGGVRRGTYRLEYTRTKTAYAP